MFGFAVRHLLTRTGQVIAVQTARRVWPRRVVMLALTIPAQRLRWPQQLHRRNGDCRHCER